MSPQARSAFLRAGVSGGFVAVVTLLACLGQGLSLAAAVPVASITSVAVILGRGFAEGIYDTSRAEDGRVKPADVGSTVLATTSPRGSRRG